MSKVLKNLQIIMFGALLLTAAACGEKGGTQVDGGTVTDGGGSDGGGTDGGGGGTIAVTIDRPGDGDNFMPGDTITFAGSAMDTRTNTAIPNTGLTWSSSISSQIGIGPQVRTALPDGAHTITLVAKAADGTSGSATIAITVAVPPLDVQIRNPNDRDIFASGQTITFNCRVRLGGNPVPAADIRWVSDLAGQIGIGAQVQTALADGSHVITCTATDPATGDSGSDSIRVSIGEPAIRITNPNDGAQLNFGDTLTFDAQAITTDPTATVTWSSDQDGQIGVGPTIQTQLATAGTHVIRATLSALVGGVTATATDQITLDYIRPNQAPVVTITDPAADGSHVATGSSVAFTGTATDVEDGDLAPTATWSDAATGATATGGSFTLANAVAGKVEVVFSATDSANATRTDTRVVYVDPAAGPLVATSMNGTVVNDWTSDAAGRGSFTATNQGITFTDAAGATTNYNPGDLGLNNGRSTGVATATGGAAGNLVAVSTVNGLSICTGAAATLNCTGYDNAIDQALGTNQVEAVVIVGDTVIAGTDRGLFVLDTTTGNTRSFNGGDWNGNRRVRDLATDSNGIVWMATDGGLVSYDPANDSFGNYPTNGLPGQQLDSVAVGPSDEVWVAFDGGIARLGGSAPTWTWTRFGRNEGLTQARVLDIVVDSNGVVWGGTDGGGAFRFNPSAGRFLMITTADGLPSNVVNSVSIGPDGEKVFGTAQGQAIWYGL